MQRYRKPLSAEVAEDIKKKILEKQYAPGEQLPAEVDFAKQMGVSRATLREAFSILHRQGFIIRRHGVGSFVAEPGNQIVSNFEKLESMMDLIRRSGYEPTMQVLESTTGELDSSSCFTMGVPKNTLGYKFSTIYSANGMPFVYTVEQVPMALFPDRLVQTREQSEDLSDFIAKNTKNPPTATLTRLKGILPTEELMQQLMIDANSPIIRQRFTLFDAKEQIVGCGLDYFNSSWFEFSIFTNTIRL